MGPYWYGEMDSRGVFSRGTGGSGVSPGSGADGQEHVSFEAFIISNWQILTILGVFAGFTNYLNNTENSWLVAFGFLLTLIVVLEILQLLLKTKNKSFLLSAFTLLIAAFILIFAGFIYSKTLADTSSGLFGELYELAAQNSGLLTGVLFLLTAAVVFLGVYRRLRSSLARAPRMRLGVDTKVLAGILILSLFLAVALAYVWFNHVPAEAPPHMTLAPMTSTSGCPEHLVRVGSVCCRDSDGDGLCDPDDTVTTTSVTTTTATTLPAPVCSANSDCGNETQKRICQNKDVYIQRSIPTCDKSGTSEARCTYTLRPLGANPLTQEPVPYEKCQFGCVNGTCIERP